MMVLLYDGAKMIFLQWKPYFRFWILIFSWASDTQYDTLSWWWAAAVSCAAGSSSSQSGTQLRGQTTDILQCTVVPAFYGYFVFAHSHHVYKMPSSISHSGEKKREAITLEMELKVSVPLWANVTILSIFNVRYAKLWHPVGLVY